MKTTTLLMAIMVASTTLETICMHSQQNKCSRKHIRSVSESSPLRRRNQIDRSQSVVTSPINKRSPVIQKLLDQEGKLKQTDTIMPTGSIK